MEFRDDIKNLRKDFFAVLREHYDTSNLILKMICNKGIYKGLSNADLSFRACMLNSLSDKNIDKLCIRNIEQAIENLRVRAVACMYIVEDIESMIMQSINISEKYVKMVEKLQTINLRLKTLAKESIKKSNLLALEYGYSKFDVSKFDFGNEEFEK